MTHSIILTLKDISKAVIATIENFQNHCEHKNLTKKHGASTGNYDPSANRYWTNFYCRDCEKRWTEEGSK